LNKAVPSFDMALRPQTLDEYVGQPQIKQNLSIALRAAKQRHEPLEHVLLYGPPGLGKTSLAYVIAHEMGGNLKITSGPALERAGDLAALLTNLQAGDILFIDEIHRLNKTIEEVFYSALEEFTLDIIIGKGPSAQTLKLDLAPFTLIGATTRAAMLSSPLRGRFGMHYHLDFYSEDELAQIIKRSATLLQVAVEPPAIQELSRRARFTPRIANRLLKRARDVAQVEADGTISLDIARRTLELLGIDDLGLEAQDRQILRIIIETFDGGPVGIKSLSSHTAEDIQTIEDMYEPFLLQRGLLTRTPKGRSVTKRAYDHLGSSLDHSNLDRRNPLM